MLWVLYHLCGPLLEFFKEIPAFFFNWPRKGLTKADYRRKITSLDLLAVFFLMHTRIPLALM